MAQTVYYVTAALALGAPGRAGAFAVPTGNFGDVFAGYVARRMGLPIERLVIGTNANDILYRLLETGRYDRGRVVPTLSPSIDIQVSSNFERLLFDLYERDGAKVAALMAAIESDGGFTVEAGRIEAARELFSARRFDDDATLAVIGEIHRDCGMLIDPHTAIGIAAGRAKRGDRRTPMVALATAHPAKFADAVERATGIRPALPERLADLDHRPERVTSLPNSLAAVQAFIAERGITEKGKRGMDSGDGDTTEPEANRIRNPVRTFKCCVGRHRTESTRTAPLAPRQSDDGPPRRRPSPSRPPERRLRRPASPTPRVRPP